MNNIKRFFRYISKNAKYIDYPLVVTYLLLCLIGLVMVYSASMVAATKGSFTGGISVPGTYFYTINVRDNEFSYSIFHGILHEC